MTWVTLTGTLPDGGEVVEYLGYPDLRTTDRPVRIVEGVVDFTVILPGPLPSVRRFRTLTAAIEFAEGFA